MYDGEIDLMNPDIAKFPEYAQTSPAIDFILEPGEVFILPYGWWHQTLIVEDSISLTHDFFNASNMKTWMDRMEARHSPTFMKTPEVQDIITEWKSRVPVGSPESGVRSPESEDSSEPRVSG